MIWSRLLLAVGVLGGMLGVVFVGSSLPAGSPDALGAGAARQAARMVQYVTLESGLGVRWEPPEALIRRLEAALRRPWGERKPLSAPFARSDTAGVTTEALAWTILAEIAYARHLKAQDSPEALVYLYLASRQVGFAQEELLDRSTGLYRPVWRDGAPSGDPKLDDQFWMLWALSEYSAAGALLPSDVARSEELFRKQTGPLADRLFRAAERFLEERPRALDEAPLVQRVLWAAALYAYERVRPSRTSEAERLRNALIPEDSATSEALRWAQTPPGERLTLAELAERVLLLGARESLRPSDLPSQEEGGEASPWSLLLSEPAVRRILAPIPWPAEVVYNPRTGEWEARAQAFVHVEAAMALAYGLLLLAPPGSLKATDADPLARKRTLEGVAQDLREMNERLRILEAKLGETQQITDLGPTTGISEPSLPSNNDTTAEAGEEEGKGVWSPWDALLVGGAVLLGLGGVLQAWRGQRR